MSRDIAVSASASVQYATVDDLLADARTRIGRLRPAAALRAMARGALLVDIRPAWQRELEIPGSWIVDRNHLEWRLHPASDARLPVAVEGQRWIVVCEHGFTSSLAAAVLVSLGVPAHDLDGGIAGWVASDLPVVAGPSPNEAVVTR